MSIWTTLGIERGADRAAIRRAYAQQLKTLRPEDDPEAFQRLRGAYERALTLADSVEASGPAPIAPELDWRIDDTLFADASPASPLPQPLSDELSPPLESSPPAETLDAFLQRIVPLISANDATAVEEVQHFASSLSLIDNWRRVELERRLMDLVANTPGIAIDIVEALSAHFDWTSVTSPIPYSDPLLYQAFTRRLEAIEAYRIIKAQAEARRTSWVESLRAGPFDRRIARLLLQPASAWVTPKTLGARLVLEGTLQKIEHARPMVDEYFDAETLRRARAAKIPDRPKQATLVAIGIAIAVAYFASYSWLRVDPTVKRPLLAVSVPPEVTDPGGSGTSTLRMTVSHWVALRHFGGKLLLYFTHLFSSRNEIGRLMYGVDAETPDREHALPPGDGPALASADAVSGKLYVEIPVTTRFVTVQIWFRDGSVSKIHKFAVPPLPPS